MTWHELAFCWLIRIASLGRAKEIAPDEQNWPAERKTPPNPRHGSGEPHKWHWQAGRRHGAK